MIAALFVQTGGCYYGLEDVDPWDEARDARLYVGPWPVVAHPPCSRWCQIAHVVQARYGYAVGDDGGCFASALESVRRFGGVLEHPAYSYAWPAYGLQRPRAGSWQWTACGGWVTQVSQRAYVHPARKRTWLYAVSEKLPPALDWSEPEPEAQVSFCQNHGNSDLRRLSKREASASPQPFRDLLISIAKSARRT